ncbi:hypothetical protein CPB84DRAFT_1844084 [Gymnopilus junonius]|uniref:DUF6532 domain-containing protein n=1 Tax=Gymnopilus junonius TaxID=109634 RepID=A0A9P5NVN9_GYMJU|nr:hypothetical protein CPB84DRAFT_1844084 [Gymnopilus junonius]
MSSISLSASDVLQIVAALQNSARHDGPEESHCALLAQTFEQAIDTTFFSGTGFSQAVVSFSAGIPNVPNELQMFDFGQPTSVIQSSCSMSHSTSLGTVSVLDRIGNYSLNLELPQRYRTGAFPASTGLGLSNTIGHASENTDFMLGNFVLTSCTPDQLWFPPNALEDDFMLRNYLTSNISNGLAEDIVSPMETINPRSLLPMSWTNDANSEQTTVYDGSFHTDLDPMNDQDRVQEEPDNGLGQENTQELLNWLEMGNGYVDPFRQGRQGGGGRGRGGGGGDGGGGGSRGNGNGNGGGGGGVVAETVVVVVEMEVVVGGGGGGDNCHGRGGEVFRDNGRQRRRADAWLQDPAPDENAIDDLMRPSNDEGSVSGHSEESDQDDPMDSEEESSSEPSGAARHCGPPTYSNASSIPVPEEPPQNFVFRQFFRAICAYAEQCIGPDRESARPIKILKLICGHSSAAEYSAFFNGIDNAPAESCPLQRILHFTNACHATECRIFESTGVLSEYLQVGLLSSTNRFLNENKAYLPSDLINKLAPLTTLTKEQLRRFLAHGVATIRLAGAGSVYMLIFIASAKIKTELSSIDGATIGVLARFIRCPTEDSSLGCMIRDSLIPAIALLRKEYLVRMTVFFPVAFLQTLYITEDVNCTDLNATDTILDNFCIDFIKARDWKSWLSCYDPVLSVPKPMDLLNTGFFTPINLSTALAVAEQNSSPSDSPSAQTGNAPGNLPTPPRDTSPTSVPDVEEPTSPDWNAPMQHEKLRTFKVNFKPRLAYNTKIRFSREKEKRFLDMEEQRKLADHAPWAKDVDDFEKRLRKQLTSGQRPNLATYLAFDMALVDGEMLRINNADGDILVMLICDMPDSLASPLPDHLDFVLGGKFRVIDTKSEGSSNTFDALHVKHYAKFGKKGYGTPIYADPSTLQRDGRRPVNTSLNVPRFSQEAKDNPEMCKMITEALQPAFDHIRVRLEEFFGQQFKELELFVNHLPNCGVSPVYPFAGNGAATANRGPDKELKLPAKRKAKPANKVSESQGKSNSPPSAKATDDVLVNAKDYKEFLEFKNGSKLGSGAQKTAQEAQKAQEDLAIQARNKTMRDQERDQEEGSGSEDEEDRPPSKCSKTTPLVLSDDEEALASELRGNQDAAAGQADVEMDNEDEQEREDEGGDVAKDQTDQEEEDNRDDQDGAESYNAMEGQTAGSNTGDHEAGPLDDNGLDVIDPSTDDAKKNMLTSKKGTKIGSEAPNKSKRTTKPASKQGYKVVHDNFSSSAEILLLADCSKSFMHMRICFGDWILDSDDKRIEWAWTIINETPALLSPSASATAVHGLKLVTQDEKLKHELLTYVLYGKTVLFNTIITKARQRVAGYFHLTVGSVEEIKDKVTWLLTKSNFFYGDLDVNKRTFNKSKPFGSPLICDMIQTLWFNASKNGSKAEAMTTRRMFENKEIPLSIVFLVVVANIVLESIEMEQRRQRLSESLKFRHGMSNTWKGLAKKSVKWADLYPKMAFKNIVQASGDLLHLLIDEDEANEEDIEDVTPEDLDNIANNQMDIF